ncbi:MAG: Asp-tRNA(Asn)/Glu-tRNA(Gln) amidotransferase subunit GatC [Thermoleophilia bacterium]
MINREEVEHVARLARLHLEENELERLRVELSKIIDYVQQISELDLAGVEPTAHAAALTNVFREDEPWEGLTQEEALAGAPQAEDGYFVVPRMS